WMAVSLTSYKLTGVFLGPGTVDPKGSALAAIVACLFIGSMWTFLWVAQKKIIFSPAARELIVIAGGFTREHRQHISLEGACCIVLISGTGGLVGRSERLSIQRQDGRSEQITSVATGGEKLARLISAATKL